MDSRHLHRLERVHLAWHLSRTIRVKVDLFPFGIVHILEALLVSAAPGDARLEAARFLEAAPQTQDEGSVKVAVKEKRADEPAFQLLLFVRVVNDLLPFLAG